MRLTGLADRLRTWGLDVVEDPGWQNRGVDFPSRPHVVVAHHTGTPQSAPGDYPTLHVVRSGRSDLPGPLCQVGIGRSGKVYVVAAGKANHAGKGAWRGHTVGNSDSVGIEAESPGDGHWTAEQRRVYPIVCAALHDLLGTGADLTCGHRESALPAGRKVDPTGIDLDQLRRDTAAHLKAGPPKRPAAQPPTPAPAPKPEPVTPPPAPVPVLEETDMALIVKDPGSNAQWVVAADLTSKAPIADAASLGALTKTPGYHVVVLTKAQLDRIPTVAAS